MKQNRTLMKRIGRISADFARIDKIRPDLPNPLNQRSI
jgi:hypothetical protein